MALAFLSQHYNANPMATCKNLNASNISIVGKVTNKPNTYTDSANVDQYGIDTYLWKYQLQKKYFVPNPCGGQLSPMYGGAVGPNERFRLLEWLAKVNNKCGFSLDTFNLTVSILDRFLSATPIHCEVLQLAGLTAFFVASKTEEVEPLNISDLVSLCARSFVHWQFRKMECTILTWLKFDILAPTASFFLAHLIEFEQLECTWPNVFTRAFLERCLGEYEFTRYAPSTLAYAIFGIIRERLYDARIQDKSFSESHYWTPDILSEYVQRLILALNNDTPVYAILGRSY